MSVIDLLGEDNTVSFAITGIGLTANDLYLSRDYLWTWRESSYNYTVEDVRNYNETYNRTYTVIVLTGDNNNRRFHWVQEWKLDPLHDAKITHTVTNSMGLSLMFPKAWYIFELPTQRTLYFGNTPIASSNDIDTQDNFNDVRRLNLATYEFRTRDLVSNNYTISNFYIGDGSRIGYDGRIAMIGVSRDIIYSNSATIVFDPEITDYKLPTDYGNYFDDWTNGQNLLADDENYATDSTPNTDYESVEDFFFVTDVPPGANITAFDIRADGHHNGIPCAIVRAIYNLYNGSEWTSAGRSMSFSSSGEQERTTDFGDYNKNWSYEEAYNIAVRVHWAPVKGFSCVIYLDQIEMRINYTPVWGYPPHINVHHPLNNSVINTSFGMLNYTLIDNEANYINHQLYVSQYEEWIDEAFIFQNFSASTYDVVNYNWSYPKVFNKSDSLWGLFHFDNQEQFGESSSFVRNFAELHHTNCTPYVTYPPEPGGYGVLGKTWDFFGEQDFLQCGLYTYENWTHVCDNGCTFNSWINHANNNTGYIIGSWYVAGARYFVLYVDSSGHPRFIISYNTSASPYCLAYGAGYFTPIGEYAMITGSYSPDTDEAKVYLNGVLAATEPCPFDSLDLTKWDTLTGVDIGDAKNSIYKVYNFNGSIDEIAIWNRTLSDGEVNLLYSLPEDTPLYWKVDVSDYNSGRNFTMNFNISYAGILCYYDCATTYSITSDVDCEENNLIFYNVGTVDIDAVIYNWGRLESKDCRIAIKKGNSWFG